MPVMICVIGKKGSGKSEVLEALITLLASRSFKVGVLKRIARENLEIDERGKDTFRYRMSGAERVVLAGKKRLALFANLNEELPFKEIASMFRNFDLVFLEGYVQNNFAKIEVHKNELGDFLLERVRNVIAVCSDSEGKAGIPLFTFEELHKLADLIESRFLKKELSIS